MPARPGSAGGASTALFRCPGGGLFFFLGGSTSTCRCRWMGRWRPLRHLLGVHLRLPGRGDVAPYQVDARRCISYLTIETAVMAASLALRSLIGNRICRVRRPPADVPVEPLRPPTAEADFAPRHGLDSATLVKFRMG